MDNCTTVFIADNSEEFCTQLAAALNKAQGFQVVGRPMMESRPCEHWLNAARMYWCWI